MHACHFTFSPSLLEPFLSGPTPIKGPFDSSGAAVGCRSACQANLDNNTVSIVWSVGVDNSTNSLTLTSPIPQIAARELLPPQQHALLQAWSFTHTSVRVFLSDPKVFVNDFPPPESNCPNSYVYAFDESSGTALWTCDSGLNADYTLTFCP
jgi:outer membrane protein assembly factor BamB